MSSELVLDVVSMQQNWSSYQSRVGHTTCLTFLGIVDTMKASIPIEYKTSLLTSIHFLLHTNKCTKHVLQSPIGKLSFTCKVHPAGSTFLVLLYQHNYKLFGMLRFVMLQEARVEENIGETIGFSQNGPLSTQNTM